MARASVGHFCLADPPSDDADRCVLSGRTSNLLMILETQLAEFLQKHPAPHAVAAVCGNGELQQVASQSDAKFGELADPAHTPFRIASMTKCFAAAAALKLRDAGRLQLDRGVAEYVPELRLDE